MQKRLSALRSPFLLLFLLPLFFVFHQFSEHVVLFPVAEGLKLLFIYWLAGVLIAFLCWLLFRNVYKAALLTFSFLTFYFFFGSAHDYLKEQLGHVLIVKYSFIIPFMAVLFLLLIVYLKRTKSTLLQTYFLNILLLVLIVSDIVALFIRLSNEKTITVTHVPLRATNCDSCVKPDVYLIIADEYTGNEVLKKNFGYDNHVFENALRQRGFHIAGNSRSNYNFTAYSLASLLSMEYLRNLEKDWLNHHDLFISRDLIKENSLVRYFRQSGYRFYNYSAFRFAGEENSITNAYFIKKSALYKSQTFISRFWRDVGFHFTPEDELMHTRKQHLYNNRINEKLLYQRVLIKEPQPKFVFTHLSMPHHPYHFDSTGKELPYYTLLNDSFRFNRNAYISYLVFTNHKLLALADHIKQKASRPYVLIILGDHGFRQYQDSRFNNDHFSNINAVYLPNQDYSRFYNGMTNVNLFRVILNTEFGQNLPLLKDSTRFTWEVEADMPPSK